MSTQKDFFRYTKFFILSAVLRKLAEKGEQYAPGENTDALTNFRMPKDQEVMDMPPAQYLMVLATKQWFVVSQWAKDSDKNWAAQSAVSREVPERIVDIIIYMCLLLFMLKEDHNIEITKEP